MENQPTGLIEVRLGSPYHPKKLGPRATSRWYDVHYAYLEDCSGLISPCNSIDDVISDGIPPTLCMHLVMLDFAVENGCCLIMDVQPALP
jgi:hypothetical protein